MFWEEKILMIAQRVRDLREIMDISVCEMADAVGMSVAEYEEYEAGQA